MRDFQEIKVTGFLPSKVTCNKCGTSKELTGDEYEREWQSNKFQSMHNSFGYGSSFDNEIWRYDLCEECLVEIVKTFKHLPDGFDEY